MQFQNKTFIALLCILITLFFYAAAYSLMHCCAIFFVASTPHCCGYTCCCVAALHFHFFANSALLCILQRQNTLSFLEQLLCPTLQIYTALCKHFLHSLLLHMFHFNSMNNTFTILTFTAVKEKISFTSAVVHYLSFLQQKLHAAAFSYLHCCVKTQFFTLS